MVNIVLYSNDCPKCKVIKNKLEKKGIEFIENNNIEELVVLGFKSLPVLKVEENLMSFVDANNWINRR